MGRKFGFSFSWKRAVGISAAKARLSRRIGIPLTRSGRQQKVGRALGCCVPICLFLAGAMGLLYLAVPRVMVAHGGGLDSLGCHHDHKRGGYHCHRGPLAGQSFPSKEDALKALGLAGKK